MKFNPVPLQAELARWEREQEAERARLALEQAARRDALAAAEACARAAQAQKEQLDPVLVARRARGEAR